MDVKLIPARIVELLERNGALKFDELYKRVRKSEKELSDNDLNSLLMKMEIQDLVRVYRIPRGKRRIELAR
ncbi:hypothetical protein GF326_12310 [Candidatus Bathyarchaeota archaeon]|nr:hypothetical protein [Candidatus Bathyarchaeota archaeon]